MVAPLPVAARLAALAAFTRWAALRVQRLLLRHKDTKPGWRRLRAALATLALLQVRLQPVLSRPRGRGAHSTDVDVPFGT